MFSLQHPIIVVNKGPVRIPDYGSDARIAGLIHPGGESCPGSGLDHRHDASLDRLGQLRPGIDHGGQVAVTGFLPSDPADSGRSRGSYGVGHRSPASQPIWCLSSVYPFTMVAVRWDGRVKARRAHHNGHSPGHDSRLHSSVYGIQPSC